MRPPGFLNILQNQLEALPFEDLERVNRVGGLEVRDIIDLLLHPKDHTVQDPCEIDLSKISNLCDSEEARLSGTDYLVTGAVGVCFVANESCLRNLPRLGVTVLESYVLRVAFAKDVWVVVPHHLLDKFTSAIDSFKYKKPKIITQYESLCLAPDNQLYYENGKPVFHPCGPGDAIEALKVSGEIQRFLESGGRHIVFSDTDNSQGLPSPSLIADHVSSRYPVTCVVTDSETRDALPVVCDHAGFDQIVERFRFSSYVEIEQFKFVFTGTMIVDASLNFDNVRWTWHRRKRVQDRSLVVQYVRYLQDLTATFRTRFVFLGRKEAYVPLVQYETT